MDPGTPSETRSLDELRQALADLARTGTPAIAGLAAWALEHTQELAFHSVRGLARRADANENTVYRLAVALGFSGFEECRAAFQAALRRETTVYGARARRLHDVGSNVPSAVHAAAQANLDALFSGASIAKIGEAATLLAEARRVYCVGVRSCLSLAHYFSYTGHMAFPNFARPLTEAGSIADILTVASPEDVVVPITFSLYSSEVVAARDAAATRGARILAITDTYASPVSRDADIVFCLQMEGPQTLPSHGAGFALVEAIVATMISRDEAAPRRISEFEKRLLDFGSYVR